VIFFERDAMGKPQRASIGEDFFEFGGFRLDPAGRQLFGSSGELIALRPKVFDTLLYLVTHSGQLLEKPVLMRAIWGKVIVGDNSLNQHVSLLRRALGDRSGKQHFIETVPRHGYRFVAEVKHRDRRRAEGENWKYIQSPFQVLLPSSREVVLSHRVAAQRERAFEVWTNPRLLRRWYPPPGWSMVACKLELRPGGTMRFVTRHTDGTEVVQQGTVREVVPPTRLVHVERWDNRYLSRMLVTTTFPSAGRHTVLNVRVRYPSRQSRDVFLESGLARDIGASYGRFARLAETGSV
jgi:DNA-binding winged helix-turn-helix (wHTH) protein